MRYRFFSLLMLLPLCLLMGMQHKVMAGDVVPYDRTRAIEPATPIDEIGLSFLHLSGVRPDFRVLAGKAAAIRQINPSVLDDFLKNETFRLQSKYASFNPQKDVVILRMEVKVGYARNPDKTSSLKIKFPHEGGVMYFPYYYADYPIAILVNGLETFQDMVLGTEETALASTYLDTSGKATLLLELQPVAANVSKPLKLDGVLQYPFLCNIRYLGLLNKQAQQIWAWETPQSAARISTSHDVRGLAIGAPITDGIK